MKNILNSVLQLLTICQAVWVLVLMVFLMWHYTWRSIKNRILEKNAIAMGISYMLITFATAISSWKGIYDITSVWQWVVIIGYGFGDYAIVRMLFHVTRNEKQKQILQEYIKKEKNKSEGSTGSK